MRCLSSKGLIALCLLASPALAQSRIDQLGAGAAVQGTDAVPNCQSCGSSTALVKTTLAQILTYIQANIVVPLTSGISGILPVANGGSGTASPALIPGTNVTITGSWPNQTINSSGGGGSSTGFGVDGGTAAVSLTASCVLGTGASCSSHSIRLVKIGTLSGPITITLDAIANLSSDSEVCLDDQGGNITGTNTLTVTANAADSIANGSAGGSDGPFTSVAGVCYRVTATHNWTRETSAIIPAFAASAHNFVTGLSALGAWSQAQPAFTDISGSASSAQLSTNLSAALDNVFSSTQGSVLYRGASTWAALGPGTSGNFLKSQGASANPTWAAVSATGCAPAGTQFEVLLDSGGGGCSDVSGLGSSGQVLTSNGAGAAPTWQPGGGGGALSLISTISAVTSSTNCTSVSIACFFWTGLSSNRYHVQCDGITSSGTFYLMTQFHESGGWETSTYAWSAVYQLFSGTTGQNASNGTNTQGIGFGTTAAVGSYSLDYAGLASGNTKYSFNGVWSISTGFFMPFGGTYTTDTNAVDGIRIIAYTNSTTPQTISAGSCSLYALSQ